MYATLSFSPLFPTISHDHLLTTSPSIVRPRLGLTVYDLSKPASQIPQVSSTSCFAARRQVRYEDESDEEYEHNEELAVLEFYTQVVKEEALLVNALVDDQQLQLLIFKGFSSSLSSGTFYDPTRSVLPATAVIQGIDRVKAPFDPSNIDYIEKNLQVEAFQIVVHKIKHVRSNLQT